MIATSAKNIQPGPDANYRDRFDDATIELVRTAKPLKLSYRKIVVHHSGRAQIQLAQRLFKNSGRFTALGFL